MPACICVNDLKQVAKLRNIDVNMDWKDPNQERNSCSKNKTQVQTQLILAAACISMHKKLSGE